jgi:hypothetical protein
MSCSFPAAEDAFEPQDFRPAWTRTRFYRVLQFVGQPTSGDQVDQFVRADLTRRPVSHHQTISEHRDAIGDRVDFRDTVRNVNDPFAAAFQLPNEREQPISLRRREARSGFIEPDDFAAARQCPRDFDDLQLRHAERRDAGRNRKLRGQRLQNLSRFRPELTPLDNAQCFGPSEEDVLRDIKLRNQARLLAYQTDPKCQSVSRIVDGDFALAIDHDGARIGRLHAEEDLHQGRFAGPVFAHQGVDFSRPEVKIHPFQCLHPRKPFDDASKFKQGLGRGINAGDRHFSS